MLSLAHEQLQKNYKNLESSLARANARVEAEKRRFVKLKETTQGDELEKYKLEALTKENMNLKDTITVKTKKLAKYKNTLEDYHQKFNEKMEEMEKVYDEKLKDNSKLLKKDYKERFIAKLTEMENSLNEKLTEMEEMYDEKLKAESGKPGKAVKGKQKELQAKLDEMEKEILTERKAKANLEEEYKQNIIKYKDEYLQKTKTMLEKLKPGYGDEFTKSSLLMEELDRAKEELAFYKSKSQLSEEPVQLADEIIPIRAKNPKIIPKINSRRRPVASVSEDMSDIEMDHLMPSSPEALGEETLPKGNPLPKETLPDKDLSEENLPEETLPDEILPDETLPDKNLIEENKPDENLLEETLPETLPEENLAEKNSPEENLPKENSSKENSPKENLPEETLPEKTLSKKTSSERTNLSTKPISLKKTRQSRIKPNFSLDIAKKKVKNESPSPNRDLQTDRVTRSSVQSSEPTSSKSTKEIQIKENDDDTNMSPILGPTSMRKSPDRTVNNSQSSATRKRRKLRNSNYLYFNDQLDGADNMSPLSKFLQSTEKQEL